MTDRADTEARPRRAVFLDRDGVVNRTVIREGRPYPPASAAEMEIDPEAPGALAELKRAGFLLIVVTNQPDVARGMQTRAEVDAIHAALRKALPLDDVLVCWHDDADACGCRKPAPGLLLEAAARHRVDLRRSYLIGDRWRDVEAGQRAGCATVWIDRGYRERGPAGPADARVGSLAEAAQWVLRRTGRRPLDIVVPFYRHAALAEALAASIRGVAGELAYENATVVAVNDSPEDSALTAALDRAAQAGVPFEIIANPRNLGFVASANAGLARALARGRDALLLNSDTLLFPGAVAEMRRVAELDPMIGFVSPRSNNATLCSLPHNPRGNGPPVEAHRIFAEISRQLPDFHFAPTAVGFCLLIKHAVLQEFGLLDETYSPGYNEENDLVMRANRCGYRAALANHAFVHHTGEGSFTAKPELEEKNATVLAQRYPEYVPALVRYFESARYEAEGMLAAMVPDAAGRRTVVFDLTSLGPRYNGTFAAAREILARAAARWKDFHVYVAASEGAARFHRLQDIPRLSLVPPDTDRTFALAFRFGQPFEFEHAVRMSRMGVVNVYAMLDPIALDCLYLNGTAMETLWGSVFAHANAVVYISDFAAAQFRRRFQRRPGLREKVCYLSLDLRDYAGPEDRRGSRGRHILVMGNDFAHKRVEATAAALRGTFPAEEIVALGLEESASGEMPHARIKALLREAKFVVFPSLYEGFGIPILEGLAFHKPVLARATPVARELCRRLHAQEHLLLYESSRELVERLAAAFPTWKAGGSLIEEYPEAGWAGVADQLGTLFRELLENVAFEQVLLPRLEWCRLIAGDASAATPVSPAQIAYALENVHNLKLLVKDREAQLADMRGSLSWRITAPLRRAAGGVQRLLGRR